MSSPVALNVKLSKTTQTCCGKEGVNENENENEKKKKIGWLFGWLVG